MTHMIYPALTVVAMATAADQNVSPWVQFLPFVLVLAIFYFVILLPMKRRQKKVQQFLETLKAGDRIVTNSGMYGTIVKIGDRTVKMQIADKVNIELSKAAIAGYQGQDPVVPDNTPQA
jgi:preprotein translocase subunit YajC